MIARTLAYALDPSTFASDALGFDPDPWQVQVLRSHTPQILNCCRQAGKSTTAAIKGLHTALFQPGSLVLLVSPSLRQSSELFRKVTDLIKILEHQPRRIEDNRLSVKLGNGSRIVSLPGKEETIRGFSGASLIIEDEAARVPDSLYYSIRPMLAVSNGQLILMSTPFGKRGHFFEEWSGKQKWNRVIVPATSCPRISQQFLAEERVSLGDWWFKQEYECQFVETEDQIFGHELIQSAMNPTIEPLFSRKVEI